MGPELPRAGLALGWQVVVGWLVSLACIAVGGRRLFALRAFEPPASKVVLAELEATSALDADVDTRQRRMVLELNERLSDIAFELELLPATYAALFRVSLASATAFTVFCVIEWSSGSPGAPFRTVSCALSGIVGGGAVSLVGRRAKQRAAGIRERWDRVSQQIERTFAAGAR